MSANSMLFAMRLAANLNASGHAANKHNFECMSGHSALLQARCGVRMIEM